ncbi:MAG: glycosyltransferase family 32 protein [Tenacibaculum sp.]
MIPKVIHYCWYGKGKYSAKIEKCIASWKENMPNYKIKKWDESNTPFNKFPFLKLLYKQKKWSFISDYIRLYAVYKQGGIYLDTDIESVKPFDELLNEKAFIGFQTDLTKSKYPINSAVFGTEKGGEFALDCIRETEIKQRLKFNAMGGPPIVTKVLYRYGLSEYKKQYIKDVLLLPVEYFYPFSWDEKFTKDCIKKETICIHWWEDSWKCQKKNILYYLDSIKRKIQKTPLLLLDNFYYLVKKDKFYYTKKKYG